MGGASPAKVDADIFGRALVDWANGGTDPEFIERDDGLVEQGAGRDLYLAKIRDWPSPERRALRFVRGRVVDVGCGAGRVALHLQKSGFDVVGVDASPLAVRATRFLGVKEAWCMSVDSLTARIARFDTIVLYGNNFGIFGTPQRLRKVLTDWARRARPGASILAESINPYCGGAPVLDRAHYRRNQQRGLLPGTVRLRTRYRDCAGPWFPWLFVSRSEMRMLLRDTGWHQTGISGGRPSEPYVAVLERDV